MGLLIDSNKIPIGYKLFSGNTHDSKTAIPMIDDLRKNFNLKKIVFVADKGINIAKNFTYISNKGDGYIVGTKIRGAKKEFINEVFNEDDCIQDGNNFKYKEILQERKVKNDDGKIITLKEKIVIFWSKKYYLREKYKREKLLPKIQNFIESPSKLKASISFGVKKYIKTIKIDDTTGEVKKDKDAVIFDQAKYDRDMKLDGYYAILTSEVGMSVNEIIGSYRELWKIEESFKVIKSDLQVRPVYVRNNDRIEGHFLTCFITPVLMITL